MVDRRIRLCDTHAFRDLAAEEDDGHTADQCLDALERVLLRRLRNANLHGIVAAAMREIEREHGGVRVDVVASRCGVSARHLNRLMRDWVGLGPKRYANIVRFQATLHGIDRAPARAPAALAFDYRYSDQAHLTVDLSRLGGATPRRLASVGMADFSKTRCDDLP